MTMRRCYLVIPLALCAAIFPAAAYAKAPSQAYIRFGVPSTLSQTPTPLANDSGNVEGILSWTTGKSRTHGVSCCRNTITDLATGQKWKTPRTQLSVPLALGGTHIWYRVSSRDGRGRVVGSVITDPTNRFFDGYVDDEPSGQGLFSGSWLTTTNARNYSGAVESSSTAGDTFTADVFGSAVAWVAITGPNHGSAQIYVDGVYVKTVSTYSKTAHYRRLVWTKRWGALPLVIHTLKIVNVATPGHPRISVDALAYLSED